MERLSADSPSRPKPLLIFGEGMSWLLQLSQAQLFTFPLSEQSSLRPAAWWRVCVCVCVWVSVSKRKHAGGLTRCTSNAAHAKTQGYKQLHASKLGEIVQSWGFYEVMDTCWWRALFCTFPSEPEEKSAADVCNMIDAPPLWPGRAFTLSQRSSHHDCVPLDVEVSEVLKGPYWLHIETVSYDEWTLAKSNLEINRLAAVSLGLCDGWINMVIKWEVATMSPCQIWQADPGSAAME